MEKPLLPEEKLMNLCDEYALSLSLAESCTGGAFAARITSLPGASEYFAGSLVSYQNTVKAKVLGISVELMQEKGTVNKEVAEAMLKGALSLFETDLALSITGIAGPDGGTAETPVGTVFIAIGGQQVPTSVFPFQLQGKRHKIVEQAVEKGLEELIKSIQKYY